MVELVVALCLFFVEEDNKILKEHYHYPNFHECLKAKRIGLRNTNPNQIILECGEVMAETEVEEYNGHIRILEILENKYGE